jgi:hypothetical protein
MKKDRRPQTADGAQESSREIFGGQRSAVGGLFSKEAHVKFDTKIAIVIREDLAVWQKINVTAFTIGGIAGTQAVIGEAYVDGSGQTYLPMIKQPVLVFAADQESIRTVYERALARDVNFSIYTEELFATGHDEANRKAVKAVKSEALNLVGLALHGQKKAMDKVLKGLSLHP